MVAAATMAFVGGAGAGGGTIGASGTLYAAIGGSTASNLYTVDPATGQATSVGPTGYAITGLAVDPTSGVMYGATSNNSPGTSNALIIINPSSGVGTLVAAFSGGSTIADITFDSNGQMYGWTESGDHPVSINKSTAAVTVLNATSLGTFGDGESIDKNGVWYDMSKGETGALWTVDKTTGAVTTVATLSNSPNGSGTMNAASFGCDGTTLWAMDGGNNGAGSASWLVTVNTSTGVMTSHGHSNVNNLDGLTWRCSNGASKPLARGGYCAAQPTLRADGTVGLFLDLEDGQPNTDPRYAGATRAFYGQSYGLTCDNLPARGYTDAGYKVDGRGVHTGTANDVYEYFAK
jgi:hypothetical protein